MKQCVYCALNEALYSLSLVFLQPYVTLSVKGVELKLVRGGEELFGLRAKISMLPVKLLPQALSPHNIELLQYLYSLSLVLSEALYSPEIFHPPANSITV